MTVELIEPIPILDIYADDIADEVELLGPNVRLTYFTWQNGQRVVVCRLVRPQSSVRGMARARMIEAQGRMLREMPVTPLMQ